MEILAHIFNERCGICHEPQDFSGDRLRRRQGIRNMHANCYEWFLVQILLWPLYMSAYGT